MALLKGKLEKLPKTLRIWLVFIPVFVVACLVYFLVLSPKARDVERIRSDISRVQTNIIAERRLLASYEPLTDEERGRIKVANRGISSLMDDLGTIDRSYNRLTNQARNCNIVDIAIDPTYTPAPDEGAEFINTEATIGFDSYKSLIKITFHSDFESLGCFLRDIEKNKDTLIQSLTVTREFPNPKIELILKVFAKELK
ncbi:MAG: hypothetical protein ACE5KK_04490 [Candidatus Brocadiales bacterium]